MSLTSFQREVFSSWSYWLAYHLHAEINPPAPMTDPVSTHLFPRAHADVDGMPGRKKWLVQPTQSSAVVIAC